MVSFRVLTPVLVALAGCVVAQDVEQTTTSSIQAESTSTPSSSALSTQTTSFSTLPAQALSNQTTSGQSLSSLTTSDPTTLSQVVLTSTSSTQTVPSPTKSSEKEKVRRTTQARVSLPLLAFSDIGAVRQPAHHLLRVRLPRPKPDSRAQQGLLRVRHRSVGGPRGITLTPLYLTQG